MTEMNDPTIAPPSADAVRSMLAGVLDPELRASIVDLGMVHDITVSPEGDVMVKVALTTAACPLRGQIGNDVSSKVAGLPGRSRGQRRVRRDDPGRALERDAAGALRRHHSRRPPPRFRRPPA